jgi:hypothetical protein
LDDPADDSDLRALFPNCDDGAHDASALSASPIDLGALPYYNNFAI